MRPVDLARQPTPVHHSGQLHSDALEAFPARGWIVHGLSRGCNHSSGHAVVYNDRKSLTRPEPPCADATDLGHALGTATRRRPVTAEHSRTQREQRLSLSTQVGRCFR
jgi:hypothetical protein